MQDGAPYITSKSGGIPPPMYGVNLLFHRSIIKVDTILIILKSTYDTTPREAKRTKINLSKAF
jgi:hypothetical protein